MEQAGGGINLLCGLGLADVAVLFGFLVDSGRCRSVGND